MSTNDDDTDDNKKGIPLQLLPFIGITTASPEQLLYVEENGNGIRSSLTPQNSMDGMNWTKGQQEEWKAHSNHRRRHHGHTGDDGVDDLLEYLTGTFMPFLRSMVNAGYDNISSACSKFFNYFQMRTPELDHEWNTASAHMDAATASAKKSPDADNFIALQRAHLQKMTVGTEIIMHGAAKTGKTDDYKAAQTDNGQLKDFDQKLADLQEQLAGKSESDKEYILQQAFPEMWDQYKAGDLAGAQIGWLRHAFPGPGRHSPALFADAQGRFCASQARFYTAIRTATGCRRPVTKPSPSPPENSLFGMNNPYFSAF